MSASTRLRLRPMTPAGFALALALAWVLFYNFAFWQRTFAAMADGTAGSALFLLSLFAVVWCVQALLLLVVPGILPLRIAGSIGCIAGACGAYFCAEYGALMNKDMLRNVLETDTAEILGLLNWKLLLYVLLLGVLPVAAIWRIPLAAGRWHVSARHRAVVAVVGLTLCAAGVLARSADYAVFLREFKPLRFIVMPVSPLYSLANVLTRQRHAPAGPLLNPAGRTVAVRGNANGTRPRVLLLVVGETARAANFQLGGYARATNPQLAQIPGVWYFQNVASCGTSTAWSVPCMFSHLGRKHFDLEQAGGSTNLLDALAMGGFAVEWRDNNAGCKGVCARVTQVSYPGHSDPVLCPHAYCYDSMMLSDLAARLQSLDHDAVIVFHQIGSHGPAYAERYPPEFERFRPACHSNELQHCSEEEIRNAYDNTILYTDHFLAQQIALLERFAPRLDSALIYASDHGESLGEQGIYLHGMPYRFAPAAQKTVPMLMWMSRGMIERAHLQPECVGARTQAVLSHDNFYHTVLGIAGLRNQVYDRSLDVLAGCAGRPVLSTGRRK
jgi:lipid A ethanolaminephosphotransferase